MNTPINLVDQPSISSSSSAANNEQVYVKGGVSYMIMDDLVVTPMSTISSITLLNQFEVKEIGVLRERVIDVGMSEVSIFYPISCLHFIAAGNIDLMN